jgi:copper chaperone CopZ
MKIKQKLLYLSLLLLIPQFLRADEVTITVKGMVCSFCAQGIKKTFGKNEKVTAVNVDLEKKLVKVETRDGESISDEELRKTINDAGYDVLEIKREKHA